MAVGRKFWLIFWCRQMAAWTIATVGKHTAERNMHVQAHRPAAALWLYLHQSPH